MGEKRERRFYQKLEMLEDRMTVIGENFHEIDELIGNRVLKKALYMVFQELTEALGDPSAMMLKKEAIFAKDDYTNPERPKITSCAFGGSHPVSPQTIFFTISAPVPWINDFIAAMVRQWNICHRSLLFSTIDMFSQRSVTFRASVQYDGYRR